MEFAFSHKYVAHTRTANNQCLHLLSLKNNGMKQFWEDIKEVSQRYNFGISNQYRDTFEGQETSFSAT